MEREEILAAVAAEQPAIERLLIDLVQAPTMLGEERAGQEIMRAAFADLGLEPREIALDPDALRSHVGSSPFSWDVAARSTWLRSGARPSPPTGAGASGAPAPRSLILNGHIDVVDPGRRTCGPRRRSWRGATATGCTAAARAT